MSGASDFLHWFNAERISVVISLAALAGVFYAALSARSAKAQAASSDRAATAAQEQAETARQQAQIARDQVDLGRKQIDLLLRQIDQAEQAEAANRQARREALEPMVVVDIAPGANDPGVFVLTIANIGPSVARNVRIVAPDEMLRSDGTKMHEWAIFTEGIKTMPPGHKMQFFFDVGFQPFKGNSPLKCTFTVDCEGPFGPAPQATYLVDLTPYEGAWAAPTTLNSVVKQLEQVAEGISALGATIQRSQQERRSGSLEKSLIETTKVGDDWETWKAVD
ncbi:hypothetical protein [Catellatospora tritici]|uniref:hypothetical protein n=1 Tax=Catellatospora tritici TaxID=2851566 RepID=UPI001C2DEEB1|nr:hypothetical protein [Catellatospora tritici]MBV1851883.1 hypothetical protein [Catellatospora tritici]